MGDSLRTTLTPVISQTVKTLADAAVNELVRTINTELGEEVEGPDAARVEAARLFSEEMASRAGVTTSAPGGSWLDSEDAALADRPPTEDYRFSASGDSRFPSSGALAAGEALAAEGASDFRVKLSDMYSDIDDVAFFRPIIAPTLTIAVVKLKNGFTLVGKSACADPANFDRQKGETFAFEDAARSLWTLKGFALVDARHRGIANK